METNDSINEAIYLSPLHAVNVDYPLISQRVKIPIIAMYVTINVMT